MKKKFNFSSINIAEAPLTKIDYILFLIIAAFCFLAFQQGDLLHTAGSSFGYLNGHILDFYDYDASFGIHPSYMPSTYILFAIWNIPIRLLGIVKVPMDTALPFIAIMWAKILPCAVYLISGIIIYKICSLIGMGTKKSKLCTYACLTMPIAFYAQFIFGQYDVFMLFFVLLGVYYYLKDEDFKFVLFFGLAITFKYTALLIFLPLLLLKCKDIWKIIRSCIFVMIPYAVEFLLYSGSETFKNYAFGIGSKGDNPTGYIFNAGIFTGFGLGQEQYTVSLVILVFGFVCALAYFTRIQTKKELVKWTFYLTCLVFFAIFGLCKWHPQWLLLAVPFWVISAFIHKDTKIFMAIDLLFMLFFTIFNVSMIPENVDQAMLNNGIFRVLLNGTIGTKLMMKDIIGVLDPAMCLSMISVIILVYAVFKHPKYCVEDFSANVDDCIGWIRARFYIGVAIFVVPALICLAVYFLPPFETFGVPASYGLEDSLSEGKEVGQVIRSEGDEIGMIQLPMKPNEWENVATLEVRIEEYESNKVLYKEELETSSWVQNDEWVTLKPNIKVTDGAYYRIVLQLTEIEGEAKLGIWMGDPVFKKDPNEYAYIDGVKQDDFIIGIKVYQ
ncbi:MAG: glycosyltransferase 87 family protein [Lachnospiraceae bacterium]